MRALKARVSCESMDVPEYQPLIERSPKSKITGDTCMDSAAPISISVPLTANPPWTALMAAPEVTVEMMTLAPPSFCNSTAGSCD